MKIDQVIEAESGTKEAKEITATLKRAGYKPLGKGADATVWSKDENTVIKIIMPDTNLDRTHAANIFYKFYEFCQQNSQYANLPRFIEIGGKHHATFNIGDKEYIQIAMERLYPIKPYSIEDDMIQVFSDGARMKRKFTDAIKQLTDPYYLGDKVDSRVPVKTANYFRSLDKETLAKYQVLYQLMVVLYHTGKINKFGWDLHGANVMKRKDGTLVITDPWFTYMGSK